MAAGRRSPIPPLLQSVVTLIGMFVGRWLDRAVDGGIFWTVSLLFAGLCLGCWLAWQRVNQA